MSVLLLGSVINLLYLYASVYREHMFTMSASLEIVAWFI